MITLRAHFDGHVLIPDEPVDLPQNCALHLEVHPLAEPPHSPMDLVFDLLNGIPVVRVPPGAKPITPEEIAELLDEP